MRNGQHAVVIGAGAGGLAAAIDLAGEGWRVTVVERASAPGGKLAPERCDNRVFDTGPTVLTLRGIFDELFAKAGSSLEAHLKLHRAEVLARHAWDESSRLDLFADPKRNADAIGQFAGAAEARRFGEFAAEAGRIFRTLEHTFIRAPRPGPVGLARRAGIRGQWDLLRIGAFGTLWRSLGRRFGDPRLRQLFARYATYCGSSPFAAPATLMLVAHAELDGVWLIEGGMHRLALALATAATRSGCEFRYGATACEVGLGTHGVESVQLATGERLDCDAVICNADVAAIAAGAFGSGLCAAVGAPAQRSLSALTVCAVAAPAGFPLVRHNVFFGRDYAREFADIFEHSRPPRDPTVYLCAQDRDDLGNHTAARGERVLCLINAPANGDRRELSAKEVDTCLTAIERTLHRCGLRLPLRDRGYRITTPADFHRRYPGTGGALYGAASHGWMASFRRPAARTRIPGFYLAGGSTHPGPGVPMAVQSGRIAAECLREDWLSMRRSSWTAIGGGISTP